jgi:NOL1/NOP2/sun family putative RNA methylase
LFFVQDAASQLAAQALGVSENDVVLDACSAPGAKTTQLASIMHNKGMIVSVDSSFDRLQKVCFNLERCGVQNVIVIQKDMLYIQDLGRTFTKILLDVPCSGNFMIDANWFSKRTLSDIRIMSLQQKKLLEKTLKVLEVGGDLVYATCSLEREENEDVISYILQDPRYKLVETGLPGSPGLTEQTRVARRFWPSVHGTQGFFIAKITRVS